MIEDDDNDNGGIDLAAWEAPEPPAGIADAVVARMREPAGAAALDAPVTRTRTRWLLGGGVLAIAGAAALVTFALRGDADSIGSGFVATAKPSHIELGAVSAADLEANTDLWWVRDGHRIVAMQPRGTATWKAAANDTIRIDAGAAVASVEASGASLRVEVQMNLSDARVLGASALTAATVAMVTVVVYEGHVKVSGAGHTVNVAPGGIVEVRPGQVPSEPVAVGADREAAEYARLQAELARKDAEIRELKRTTRERKGDTLDSSIVASTVDHVTIDDAIKARMGELRKCGKGTFLSTMNIDPSGAVVDVATEPAGPVGNCVAEVMRTVRVTPSKRGTTVRRPIVLGTCDFDALVEQGEASLTNGNHAHALVAFEAALACKQDATVELKAFVAACNAKHATKARGYFARIPSNRQSSLLQICLRNGIDPRPRAAEALDRTMITAGIAAVQSRVLACDAGTYTGTLRTRVRVGPDGAVTSVVVEPDAGSLSKCVADAVRSAKFEATQQGGAFNYPFVFDVKSRAVPAAAASCQPADRVDPFDKRPVCTKTGVLRVNSKPAGEIVIDGVATGKRAPARFDLTPGKHKVTFVVGDDRFTFVATIKAGEVLSMHKDLQ